jgi:hypothetical protein
LVGILLGDGSLGICPCGKRRHIQYRLKITLDSRNQGYTAHVAMIFEQVFGFAPITRKRKGENTCDVLSFKKEIVCFLLRHAGLQLAPKWNRAIVPEKYARAPLSALVLRGYFDTDGTLVIFNNNGTLYPKIEMKVSPSPMQNQLRVMARSLGFRVRTRKLERGKELLQINGTKQVVSWFEVIGPKNPVHVRKLKMFLARTRVTKLKT